MSYNKHFFWKDGGRGGRKCKSEVKDENKASYFYVQGAQ